MYKNLFLPTSILVGIIIGAGMFSLPFVFQQSGLVIGVLALLFFAFIYALVYFIYADIILRTDGDHRLVGYSKMYLGKVGFLFSFFISLLQLFFVLTIYLILAPSFTQLIIGGSYINHLLFFWIISSLIISFSVRKLALTEFLIVAGMALIIFLIFISGLLRGNFASFEYFNYSGNIFAVIGPVLFALSGTLAIPEVIAYFKESGLSLRVLKKSLIGGSFLSALAYIAFVVGVLALSGIASEDAVSGLINTIPAWLLIGLGVLGFFSIISSYIVVGLNIRKTMERDFNFSAAPALIAVIFIPITLYFLGMKSFIKTVSFMGSVFVPLEIMLLIGIWLKMDKIKPSQSLFNRSVIKRYLLPLFILFVIVLLYVIIK